MRSGVVLRRAVIALAATAALALGAIMPAAAQTEPTPEPTPSAESTPTGEPTPSADPTSTPTDPPVDDGTEGDQPETAEPAPDATVTVTATGTIATVIREGPMSELDGSEPDGEHEGEHEDGAEEHDHGHEYLLVTDDAQSIRIEGDVAEELTGEGVVVEATLEVPVVAADVEDAGVAPGEQVDAGTAAGDAVVEAQAAPAEVIAMEAAGPAPQPSDNDGAGAGATHRLYLAIATNSGGGEPTQTEMETAIAAASTYWAEATNGGIAGFQVYDVDIYPTTYGTSCVSEYSYLQEAAQRFSFGGYSSFNGNTTPGSPPRNLVVITPESCRTSLSWGLGTIGQHGADSNGWVTMPGREQYINNTTNEARSYAATMIHELGHNLGLDHAQARAYSPSGCTTALWTEATCSTIEYGDPYSPMTLDWLGNTAPAIDAAHRAYFGFPSGFSADQSGNATVTYALSSTSSATGLRAIHIVEPGTGRNYYVEYRDGTGQDSLAAYMRNGGQSAWHPMGTLGNQGTICYSSEPTSCSSAGNYGWGTGVRVVYGEDAHGTYDRYSYAAPVRTNNSYPTFLEMAEEAGEEYRTTGGTRIEILSISGGTATVRVTTGSGSPGLSPTPAPVVAGKPKLGETLEATVGAWGPSGVDVQLDWLRDGVTVVATDTDEYVVQPADVGHTLQVRATGTLSPYPTVEKLSAAVTVWTLADQGSPQRNFVAQAYRDFLGREPTNGELNAGAAVSRPALLQTLSTSTEWLSTIITGFYRQTLGRDPDANGLNFWISQARAGMPVVDIAAFFYASDEYFNGFGGGSYGTWGGDLYDKLMERPADANGRAYWVSLLNSGTSRQFVATFFYQSTEKLGRRVEALYESLLGRPAEASGKSYWSQVIKAAGDIKLASLLGESTEYFNNAQTPH